MAGIPRKLDGMLHGLIAFSVTTIFTFLFLTTSLGTVISGGFGLLNSGAQAASSTSSSGMAPQMVDAAKGIVPPETTNGIDNTRNEIPPDFAADPGSR